MVCDCCISCMKYVTVKRIMRCCYIILDLIAFQNFLNHTLHVACRICKSVCIFKKVEWKISFMKYLLESSSYSDDIMNKDSLWDDLQFLGAPAKIVNILSDLCSDTMSVIWCCGGTPDVFLVTLLMRQGSFLIHPRVLIPSSDNRPSKN